MYGALQLFCVRNVLLFFLVVLLSVCCGCVQPAATTTTTTTTTTASWLSGGVTCTHLVVVLVWPTTLLACDLGGHAFSHPCSAHALKPVHTLEAVDVRTGTWVAMLRTCGHDSRLQCDPSIENTGLGVSGTRTCDAYNSSHSSLHLVCLSFLSFCC